MNTKATRTNSTHLKIIEENTDKKDGCGSSTSRTGTPGTQYNDLPKLTSLSKPLLHNALEISEANDAKSIIVVNLIFEKTFFI
jgi:hypothetical protein